MRNNQTPQEQKIWSIIRNRQFYGYRFLRQYCIGSYIVDFICRGVNSPKVYRKYLDSLERKFGGKVVYVKAKNKELGWRNLTRKVVFDNGKSYKDLKVPWDN